MAAQTILVSPSTESHAPSFLKDLARNRTTSDYGRLRPSQLRNSSNTSIKSVKDVKEPKEDKHTEDVSDVKEVTEEKLDPQVEATVSAIMDILETFSLQQQGNDVFLGREVFSPRVREHVAAGRAVPMVLPAFPAKSINTEEKVLGTKPDLGEELALDRLNDLCTQIRAVHEPGATVLIATDGACYNDLTGVTDDNLWQYGAMLRKMVADKGYRCIEFVRIMNLLGLHNEEKITKERFIELLEPSRKALMERYGDMDVAKTIKEDPDYKMTYDGYARFLKKDLAFSSLKDSMTSGKKWKAKVSETAKAMIGRGVAFAALIRDRCPQHVRLSIHPSTGQTKISMPLIPQPNSFSMTPWHCAVAVDARGRFNTAHVADLRRDHDLVRARDDGRPYCFRERTPLYEWDADVDFEHLYGGGLVVHNNASSSTGDDKKGDANDDDGKAGAAEKADELLSDADKEKLVALAVLQGKIVLEGF